MVTVKSSTEAAVTFCDGRRWQQQQQRTLCASAPRTDLSLGELHFALHHASLSTSRCCHDRTDTKCKPVGPNIYSFFGCLLRPFTQFYQRNYRHCLVEAEAAVAETAAVADSLLLFLDAAPLFIIIHFEFTTTATTIIIIISGSLFLFILQRILLHLLQLERIVSKCTTITVKLKRRSLQEKWAG